MDLVHVLAICGVIGLLSLFFDTIKNMFQMIRSILAPYLLANEITTLSEKYGQWACKY